MTEDDTFWKLKKFSFDEIRQKIDELEEWDTMSDEEIDEWMINRGWTYHHYVKESAAVFKRYINGG